jgi:hypothetical protein
MKRWRSFTADSLRRKRKKEEEDLTQRTQSPRAQRSQRREEKRREEKRRRTGLKTGHYKTRPEAGASGREESHDVSCPYGG